MSQATVTLPIDSYNRLVEQAQAKQTHAMTLAQRLEDLRAKPMEMSQRGLGDFISTAISILRSPLVEPKAAIPEPELPPVMPAPKSTTPRSRD